MQTESIDTEIWNEVSADMIICSTELLFRHMPTPPPLPLILPFLLAKGESPPKEMEEEIMA
ncbi:MAG: hypothetical protein QNJ97_15020 [Myxococcota bacterium]|nr:hypothetical protein [Myxococcota bacterium]